MVVELNEGTAEFKSGMPGAPKNAEDDILQLHFCTFNRSSLILGFSYSIHHNLLYFPVATQLTMI